MAMKSADGRSAPSWCVSSAPAASAAKGRPRPARYSHLGCLILGALAMSASGLARTAQAAPVVAGSGVPASSADAAFTQHFRNDDTYARTAGAWRVLYTQVTVLPR
jgi:hypothetical protein